MVFLLFLIMEKMKLYNLKINNNYNAWIDLLKTLVFSNFSTTWLPMYPAPPVTKILFM